ncbi:hypothetical protein R0J91_15050, partial [Micrococcus sp. SIMBA_131]
MKMNGTVSQSEKEKWEEMGRALNHNKGHSLLLFSSLEEMNRFRNWADQETWNFTIIYEGDREISETVKAFQREHSAVLCSYHLWEGLD